MSFLDTPFGQVPYLEVDGTVLCQCHVIEAFLANRFGKKYVQLQ